MIKSPLDVPWGPHDTAYDLASMGENKVQGNGRRFGADGFCCCQSSWGICNSRVVRGGYLGGNRTPKPSSWPRICMHARHVGLTVSGRHPYGSAGGNRPFQLLLKPHNAQRWATVHSGRVLKQGLGGVRKLKTREPITAWAKKQECHRLFRFTFKPPDSIWIKD